MNTLLGPPSPNSKVQPLPVLTDGRCCVSIWQLDDEELLRVIKTRCIQLTVFSGGTQPPVSITSPMPQEPAVS